MSVGVLTGPCKPRDDDDRELRLLTLDALERIEVAVRSVIVNEMCLRHGSHWFMDTAHFDGGASRFKHHELLNKIDREFNIPALDAAVCFGFAEERETGDKAVVSGRWI